MKVLKVIVDEMPKKCDQECPFECDWQCRAHDWEQLYAEDFGKIPSWCPLELETDGWKPVSEKPTKSMYVLICHVGDDYARTSWYSENEGDFYWWGDKQDLDLWRPLPVAPKEVKNE